MPLVLMSKLYFRSLKPSAGMPGGLDQPDQGYWSGSGSGGAFRRRG